MRRPTSRFSNNSESWSRNQRHKLTAGYSLQLLEKRATLTLNGGASKSEGDTFRNSTNRGLDGEKKPLSESSTLSKSHTTAPWQFRGGAAFHYRRGLMLSTSIQYTYADERSNIL